LLARTRVGDRRLDEPAHHAERWREVSESTDVSATTELPNIRF